MDREQVIREKAYQLWKIRAKNNIPGTPEQDWHMAELYYKLVIPKILIDK